MSAIRWMAKNLGTLILSIILALAVWASAVVTADPNQVDTLNSVPIEKVGQASDLLITNEIPTEASITLQAPRSIWEQLHVKPGTEHAWIDLTGLAAGTHTVPLHTRVNLNPVRTIKVEPAAIEVVLEPLTTKTLPVHLRIQGEPPLGYRSTQPQILPEQITISGPASAVERVTEIVASIDIAGSTQNVKALVPVQAVDQNGVVVPEATLSPKEVSVDAPINILGGYKNVAVKVLTKGQVENGYRLTNISVTPPTVTIYSNDPQSLNDIAGYVDTLPVDLTGLQDDAEFNSSLNLPKGVSLVNEPSVLVQVGIAAIEGSLTLSLPVEPLGLPPTLAAQISPVTIDLIITGPLPVLDTISPASFRAVVDLTGYEEGTYQIKPTLDLAPDTVQIQTMLPETVQVIVSPAPTTTPSPATTGTPKALSTSTSTPTSRP
jgi:YbbR domain-containing protein